MRSDELPTGTFDSDGRITSKFETHGIESFREAVTLVGELPHGKTTDLTEYELVLEENRGTCVTKHALLAVLADEQDIDVSLVLRIYEMTEANTPGMGQVLEQYGLDAVPEAHCVLDYRNQRIDVKTDETLEFIHEETIRPSELDCIDNVHRSVIEEWVANADVTPSPNAVWEIEQECVRLLNNS